MMEEIRMDRKKKTYDKATEFDKYMALDNPFSMLNKKGRREKKKLMKRSNML